MNPKNYRDSVYKIIGSAMTVHNTLGWGLLEAVYNEALQMELLDRGINSETEKIIPCFYKNRQMEKFYKMDLMVGEIIVELKSVKEIVPAHRAQLFSYLRLTHKPIGLLMNFGGISLQTERYAYIEETNECVLMDKNMNLLFQENIDENL
jgi:hypothetical protein